MDSNNIYDLHKQPLEKSDTLAVTEIKESINETCDELNKIYAKTDSTQRLTRTDSNADKLAILSLRLNSLQEELVFAKKGGGSSNDYDRDYIEIISLFKKGKLNAEGAVNELLLRIKSKRTRTRYSFDVLSGMQGPHTVARILGVCLRHTAIINNIAKLKVSDLSKLYDPHIDTTLADTMTNSEYIDFYRNVAKKYADVPNVNTLENFLSKIALGQMLVDLHPYATSLLQASGEHLQGKGEGHVVEQLYSTKNLKKIDELIDTTSLKDLTPPTLLTAVQQFVIKTIEGYKQLAQDIGVAN
jgi:hypothetical protein